MLRIGRIILFPMLFLGAAPALGSTASPPVPWWVPFQLPDIVIKRSELSPYGVHYDRRFATRTTPRIKDEVGTPRFIAELANLWQTSDNSRLERTSDGTMQPDGFPGIEPVYYGLGSGVYGSYGTMEVAITVELKIDFDALECVNMSLSEHACYRARFDPEVYVENNLYLNASDPSLDCTFGDDFLKINGADYKSCVDYNRFTSSLSITSDIFVLDDTVDSVVPVPLPPSLALMLAGLGGLAFARHARRAPGV